MSNVLTVVFDKAEQKIDSVIAATVNELHSLGHVVKEVRVMGDSGEAKVALNTVEGIVNNETTPADSTPAATPADTVENKNPDGSSSVAHTGGAPTDVPVDTPLTAQGSVTAESDLTIDQKRDALLAQLESLDAEEEAQDTTSNVDPTNSAGTPATGS